jgi:hypothetical protein
MDQTGGTEQLSFIKKIAMNNFIMIPVALMVFSTAVFGQEAATEQKDNRPVREQFESGYIIDNQTVVVKTPGTLEFIIQHRFGTLNSETFDLLGLYAPSNIRMGLNYTLRKDLLIGAGSTKNNKLQDANIKYTFLKQTRSNSIPVSVAVFSLAAYDLREDIFEKSTQRLSYFSQLIIARSFGRKTSVQIAPSYSHFNIVDSLVEHSSIGVSVNGRYKFSPQSSVVFSYDHNMTEQKGKINDALVIEPMPNLSIGLEVSTSSHVFQVFASTYNAIINQYSILYNTHDFTNGDILIGFNITRLWNFQRSK